MEIRNVAIIAHVDHGKTTLVDALLKQTHTFRDNQKEMNETLILDSNALEKEKGITILAKNTAIFYQGTKINIIDTPGHADFGGEVERTINMASGALLLVDASEGPLPQTRFVLKKALDAKLRIILIINKIDKKAARPTEILAEVENLFLELARDASVLDFKTLYAIGREGQAFTHLPVTGQDAGNAGLTPLLDTILQEIPNGAVGEDKPLQMLISTLDYDNFLGRLCIGKVHQGVLKRNQTVALVDQGKVLGMYRVRKLYTTLGLERTEVEEVYAGDIATLAGIPEMTIGQTVADPRHPVSLPKIEVEEPTIKISIGPNSSPLSGREGQFVTSRQIKERLLREKETNLGLRIEEGVGGTNFIVCGRGELHLAVLVETMRREGYEMEVSRPQVIYKEIDGETCEPYEEVTIEVDDLYLGVITEELGKRGSAFLEMRPERNAKIRFVYKISSRNLLGLRNVLLTATRGTAQINSCFLGYAKKGSGPEASRNGALIASKSGTTLSYGLTNAQERGTLFVGPGTAVYEGMIVGMTTRPLDIEVNVCKEKQQTNNRSAGEGVSVQLTPPTILSLEQYLSFIGDDELLEVTPKSLRARKKYLTIIQRRIHNRQAKNQAGVI